MACAVAFLATAAALCRGTVALKLPATGKQLPGDPFQQPLQSFPLRAEKPETPRMLGMRGCSGSTAIDEIARKLFRMHGLNVAPAADPVFVDGNPVEPEGEGWPSELLRPDVNWLYDQAGGDISKAMELQVERAAQKNQTLFFKGLIHELASNETWSTYLPFFNKYGLYTMLAQRWNQLDEIVCQVRDCFSDNYGHPVDAAGMESSLCFERRNQALDKPPETFQQPPEDPSLSGQRLENETATLKKDDYKAFIRVEHLVWAINKEYELHEEAGKKLREAGFQFDDLSAEDLLEFQTVKEKSEVEKSLNTWGRFLQSFGVEPDYERIRSFLHQSVGSYPEPPPHREVIYNIDEVYETLLNSKYDYAKFVRK